MANIYQIPDSNANNNGVPGWLPYVSNGGGFGGLGGNGWGGGKILSTLKTMNANSTQPMK